MSAKLTRLAPGFNTLKQKEFKRLLIVNKST